MYASRQGGRVIKQRTANPLGSAHVGSNPILVNFLLNLLQLFFKLM